MKLSINWLKDYVKLDMSTEKLANRMTLAGLEVEKIEIINNDTVFELEITPNRPDCLNIIGLAREVSAITNKPLKYPSFSSKLTPKIKCPVVIEDKDACQRYIGTIIENVKVGSASTQITERLSSMGLRAINNIVDITNFCLMEMGQPLHAFDLDKLAGGKIVVRRARQGEKIVTLDGVQRTLDPSILVIADERKPVAIAGIMGGKETEVTLQTKNILLESAYFNPILIRRAARKLGLSSDSSYRFERGVDFDGVRKTSDRAVALILDLAGGKARAQSDLIVKARIVNKKRIGFSLSNINSFLGANLPSARCKNILEKLGFDVKADKKGNFSILAPSHRGDIKTEVDIVEELARVVGFDELPMSLPQIMTSNVLGDVRYELRKKIRDKCLSLGLDEAVCYTLTDEKSLLKAKLPITDVVRIQNPLSQEQEMMRPSPLPALLNTLVVNVNRGEKNVKIFEIGKVYIAGHEKDCLAILSTGKSTTDWRATSKQDVDFYDLKGVVENVAPLFDFKQWNYYPSHRAHFDQGACADIVADNNVVGEIGKISEDVLAACDVKIKSVFYAFLDLQALFGKQQKINKYTPISEYPAITRDVSLAIKDDVSFQQVEQLVRRVGGELLADIRFQEQYLGEKIPTGQKGLVFSLNYQSREKTLRDEEIGALHEKIVQMLIDQLGAVRR